MYTKTQVFTHPRTGLSAAAKHYRRNGPQTGVTLVFSHGISLSEYRLLRSLSDADIVSTSSEGTLGANYPTTLRARHDPYDPRRLEHRLAEPWRSGRGES